MTDYTTTDHYSQFNVLSWQPIETAPKDGTKILVYKKYSRFGSIVYDDIDLGTNVDAHYIEIAYWTYYGWRIDAFSPPSNKDPTHWIPLPLPPKKGDE